MRQLKLNKSGIIIPVMSLGTWAFGGDAIWERQMKCRQLIQHGELWKWG